jgi:hypothetical protein
MTDNLNRNTHPYTTEIVLPDSSNNKYKLDLVHLTDDEREHRLTLAQYTSWSEAEEHLNEVNEAINTNGFDAIADDIGRLQEQINNPLHFTFGDDKQPINQKDEVIPHHVDGGGTVHWFDRVESRARQQSPYELRYFRAFETDSGNIHHDSYAVMPMAEDDPNLAWPLAGLELYLEKGDVFMAQQFARDVADTYDQFFPDPMELSSLNPAPEYYFGYGIGPNNQPSLEAVKTWMQGSERQFDTLTVGEYGTFDEVAIDERELEQLLDSDRLETAMNLAETMAVTGGYLDPERDDLRIFFEDDAPEDPFTTNRGRELAEPEYTVGAISANGQSFVDVMKTWGKDDYERLVIPQPNWNTAYDLYEVADDLLQNDDLQGAMHVIESAAIDAGVIDPERSDGRLFTQGPDDPFTTIRQTQLNPVELETEEMPVVSIENDVDEPEPVFGSDEWLDAIDRKREANATLEGADWFEATFDGDWQLLEPLDDTVNYSVSVNPIDPDTIELAVEKVWRREDNFTGLDSQTIQTYDIEDGHEQAEADRDTLLQVHEERGLQGMMRQAELQAMKNGKLYMGHRPYNKLFGNGSPDRFETLAQQLENETNPYWNTDNEEIPEPEQVDNPYWRLETVRANNPDGEQIGHALQMVVYPNVEQSADDVGSPDIPNDEPFQILEMAHFDTPEDANKFSKEFRGYLVPGLLSGPELAEEVARLEEHPIEWKTPDGQDLDDYRNLDYVVTHDIDSWKLYNPHAERDARLRFENGDTQSPQFETDDIDF